MKEFDLVIIGGGAAGFAAAHKANQLKKKTLLINSGEVLPLGGTCVNVGCIPSKIMLHIAEMANAERDNKFRSLKISAEADFVRALEETRELVLGFRKKNYEGVLPKQEFVEFREGKARLVDESTVEAGGELFKAEKILISAGASTFIPPVRGIDSVPFLTNKNVFELRKKPSSVIILGGGAEAAEFSQIFSRFGIKTTLVQRSDRILKKADGFLAKLLQGYLEEEGIAIKTKAKAMEVAKTEKGVALKIATERGNETIEAEELFVATGLKPNTEGLGLEKAGVEIDERGFVKANEFMQTNIKSIYAAGDVTGIMPLETVAAKQGSVAVENMFSGNKKTISYAEIPKAVFTSPQLASVGISEEEYIKKHNTCMCSVVRMDHVEKALATKRTKGAIKMVLDPNTKKIIGIHILSDFAADLVAAAAYIVKNGMTTDDVRSASLVFPTLSEMIKKAAQSFSMDLDAMACCVE